MIRAFIKGVECHYLCQLSRDDNGELHWVPHTYISGEHEDIFYAEDEPEKTGFPFVKGSQYYGWSWIKIHGERVQSAKKFEEGDI